MDSEIQPDVPQTPAPLTSAQPLKLVHPNAHPILRVTGYKQGWWVVRGSNPIIPLSGPYTTFEGAVEASGRWR